MLKSGSLIHGRYEIVGVIGSGGMSTVYLANDAVAHRRCAIKDVERRGEDQNNLVVQSLAAEGRMLMGLADPHLPKIYDVIEDADSFMLVMDYVDGESLDKLIARTGPQKPENAVFWAIQICEVLEYLHSQDPPVVYRDMKPANVILQPDGNIMLIDFGTARTQKNKNMSSDTICIGTEGFAAPEQYGGNGQSDARTDVFCLGSTIYNIITGHSPSDPPKGIRPMREMVPELAGSPIEQVIMKCTRPDPGERFQSALELKEALISIRDGTYNKRGRSGRLSGGFQVQQLKGIDGNTGALSGLLNRGKGRTEAQQTAQAYASGMTMPPTESLFDPIRDTRPTQTAVEERPERQEPFREEPIQPPGDEIAPPDNSGWRNAMLIAIAAAVVSLLVSVLFAILGSTAATVAALSVCFCALAVTGVSAFFAHR